jgi:ADP-ribose pyrophosphatase YjhB (NUDIX family)
MIGYEMSKEEKEYLAGYDRTAYPCPSLTADIAVFAVMNEETKEYRLDPVYRINLLLIKRGGYPYRGYWALPGGFCRENESIEEAAARELMEETGIEDAYMESFGMFSEAGRDPRGWIVSQAYMALVDPSGYRIRSGSDAWEAEWFSLEVDEKVLSCEQLGDRSVERTQYRLELKDKKNKTTLSSAVIISREQWLRKDTVSYEITDCNGLAFDHAKIILKAYLALRDRVEKDIRAIFYLMPGRFTLTSLQRIYEIVVNHEVITPNFRRKIAPYVRETDEMIAGVGHRPARLFEPVLSVNVK